MLNNDDFSDVFYDVLEPILKGGLEGGLLQIFSYPPSASSESEAAKAL